METKKKKKKVYNYKNAHEPQKYRLPQYTYDDIWGNAKKKRELKPLSKVIPRGVREAV